MTHISGRVGALLLVLLVLALPTRDLLIEGLLRGAYIRGFLTTRTTAQSRLFVSVGGGVGGGSTTGKKQVGFLISPSPTTGEDEMMIIQNLNQISKGENTKLGIIGTNDLGDGHKKMIELLSYALVLSGNHIFTSGGGNGTNRAVISGALRACNPNLLTVILPQSILRQPPEMQSILMRVGNLIQQPEMDDMDFKEAANLCNEKILLSVDKLLVFAYHDSSTVLKTAFNAEDTIEDVTIFYLD